jgi:hypothetical protein
MPVHTKDSMIPEAVNGAWNVDMKRRSVQRAAPINAGATSDRRPDATVVRGMAEIDPRLSLEWRPMGQWWTTWGVSERPSGASYGAWRLTLKGRSGQVMGLKLCPPWWGTSANCGELVAYLRSHWSPRLKNIRDYYQTTEAFSDELSEKASRARRMEALDKIDHGELRHASRFGHAESVEAGFSGREYFSAGMAGPSRL